MDFFKRTATIEELKGFFWELFSKDIQRHCRGVLKKVSKEPSDGLF